MSQIIMSTSNTPISIYNLSATHQSARKLVSTHTSSHIRSRYDLQNQCLPILRPMLDLSFSSYGYIRLFWSVREFEEVAVFSLVWGVYYVSIEPILSERYQQAVLLLYSSSSRWKPWCWQSPHQFGDLFQISLTESLNVFRDIFQ